jgi:RimJ/RimL family protein N-acetyltransferase
MLARTSHVEGNISVRPPDPAAIRGTTVAPDVAASVATWLSRALERDDVCYFSIYEGNYEGERLVGQILLHDIQFPDGEALVGYHLFQTADRGRGIGTVALRLLQRFVIEHTTLTKLVIITSADNLASRRMAERCGFRFSGPPREDPTGVALLWRAPRS